MSTKDEATASGEIEKLRVEYDMIKTNLQLLYEGKAGEYENTRGDKGKLFPPSGMCYTNVCIFMVDKYQKSINAGKMKIQALEMELAENPYAVVSPHPMIRLVPTALVLLDSRKRCDGGVRLGIMKRIAEVQAEIREAKEHLDFWTNSVKPASDAYLNELAALFEKKKALRVCLLEKFGIHVDEW